MLGSLILQRFPDKAVYEARGLSWANISLYPSGAGRDAIKNAHNQNNPHFLREKGTRFFARAGKKVTQDIFDPLKIVTGMFELPIVQIPTS